MPAKRNVSISQIRVQGCGSGKSCRQSHGHAGRLPKMPQDMENIVLESIVLRRRRTLGRFRWVFWKRKELSAISMRIGDRKECVTLLTIREDQLQLQHTTLPQRILLSRDGALPSLEVQSSLRSAQGLCDEAERMVTAPLLPT